MKPIQFRLILAFALLALWLGPPTRLHAAAWPDLLNYQGQLTDASGSAVPDATYSINFNLYTVSGGGVSFWSETQTVTTGKGLFNVILGQSIPLSTALSTFGSLDIWIGLKVGADLEMTPRQQLLPSLYSTNARNAQTLSGASVGAAAFNIPQLNAAGQIPASMIAGGSMSVPIDLTGPGGPYNLNVNNSTGAGIISKGSTSNTGIWGQTPAGDTASAIGVRGTGTNGTGIVAESSNSNGLSATSASAAGYAIYASATNPMKLVSKVAGIGIQLTNVVAGQTVNVLDGINNAGIYALVNNTNMFGVSATSSGSTAVYGRSNSNSSSDYGVWGDNSGASGTGVYGTGVSKGVYGVGSTYGVYGSGSTYGLYGQGGSYGVYGQGTLYGVYGFHAGGGYGVFGNGGSGGIGVYGTGTWGVHGVAAYAGGRGVSADGSSNGHGVYSIASNVAYNAVNSTHSGATGISVNGVHSGAGAGIGVMGASATGVGARGVYGVVSGTGTVAAVQGYTSSSTGVAGLFNNSNGVGLAASGTNIGVSVTSTGNYGVLAKTNLNGSYAIYGENTDSVGGSYNYGVYGKMNSATSGFGVYGDGYEGVHGLGSSTGVYGDGQNYGVYGTSVNGYAIYAQSANGYGVYSQTSGSNFNTVIYNSYASGNGLTGAGMLVESKGTPIWAYMDPGGNGDGILVNYNGTTGSGVNVQYGGSSGAAGNFNSSGSSGLKYGVQATEASSNASTAAGRFDHTSTTGPVYGIWATTDSNAGIAGRFEAQSGSGLTQGIYATNISATDGASAGHFFQSGNAATLNGNYAVFAETNQPSSVALYAYNSSGSAYGNAIVASGLYNSISATARICCSNAYAAFVGHGYEGFLAKPTSGGYGYRVDTTDDPTYGFYFQNTTAINSGSGVYSYNQGATAIAGTFFNTSATVGAGAALQVSGRMNYPSASGVVTVSIGSSSGTIVNSFIRTSSNTTILLTPLTDPQYRYYVSNIGTTLGQATVQMNAVVSGSAVTFQYMIFGK